MAFPLILVNSATGSDTTASGAGPGTAISGSTGRTRNTAAQLVFGFFGATDDFSGVAVDGSATCYMAIATAAARNHSSIAAMKNTRQTGTDGAITTATAILVVGSTTGWSVGDVIKVTGAGAASADLYSTILTVDSGVQATLNDNAGTTVAGAAWENPKQATLTTSQGVNTGATNTAWAIGGTRASIAGTNSKKLFDNNSAAGDAMPGWIVEMASGHSESISVELALRRAGDLTSGPIILRGVAGAATLPKIRATANTTGLGFRGSHQQFRNFEISAESSAVSRAVLTSTGTSHVCEALKLSRTSTNLFTTGIEIVQQVIGCEVAFCTTGISSSVDNHSYLNNYIHDCSGSGISASGFVATGNLITACADGIVSSITGNSNRALILVGNTINACTAAGIKLTGTLATGNTPFVIANNILSNNGTYGLHFSQAASTLAAVQAMGCQIKNNNTFNNTTAAYLPAGCGEDDPGLNPTFTNTGTGDYSIGTNLKAKGYPLGGTLPVGGTSATYSYVDIGAAQRQESAAGGAGQVGAVIGQSVRRSSLY